MDGWMDGWGLYLSSTLSNGIKIMLMFVSSASPLDWCNILLIFAYTYIMCGIHVILLAVYLSSKELVVQWFKTLATNLIEEAGFCWLIVRPRRGCIPRYVHVSSARDARSNRVEFGVFFCVCGFVFARVGGRRGRSGGG